MPHPPALQRTILQNLEIEAGIGQEYSEPEIHRGEIREELDLIGLARRRLCGHREQIVGELVRECGDETVGSLQQSRNVADLYSIARDGEGAERVFLWSDHGRGEGSRC